MMSSPEWYVELVHNRSSFTRTARLTDLSSVQGSKDGKTAWKLRKAAMEEVENVLKRCSGLLDTSKMKPIVELLRALRERLSDSQSNLKPVAARLIGCILSSVDAASQGKLGRVVYAPLINAAMNDKKKNMHDAAMEALRVGTSLAALEGEGPNEQALESFVVALAGELDESEFKVGAVRHTSDCVFIPDVLMDRFYTG